MEIFFCDICNESVPEKDLITGRAYRLGERIVCGTCERLMTPSAVAAPTSPYLAPDRSAAGSTTGTATAAQSDTAVDTDTRADAAAATSPRGGRSTAAELDALRAVQAQRGSGAAAAGGVVVGLFVLVFAAAGFALLLGELESASEDTAEQVSTVRREFAALGDRLAAQDLLQQERVASAQARSAADRAAALGEVQASLEGLRAQLGANGERFEGVSNDLDRLRASQEDGLDTVEGQVSALGQQLLEVERHQRATDQAVEELAAALEALLSTPAALPAGPGGAGAGDPVAGRMPWEGLLADLEHSNPGLRLDAVYALGETRDGRVVPHLLPKLEDEDLFVRMATTHVLVDLNAKVAVPNLIDTLEDDSSPVREAAVVALRDLTGEEFGFEPLGSDSARKKRVDDWRDWWKRNGDDFLTGTP